VNRNVALIYVRVSRLDREDRIKHQEGNGAKLRALSPATQEEQCKGLPALRGLRTELFDDLHRSGKDTHREGLERLRARIQDPDVAVVAVWSITRLARSVRDLYELLPLREIVRGVRRPTKSGRKNDHSPNFHLSFLGGQQSRQ
jgi:DNA invertase Pin-like site-specific DNA recombinase